MIGIISTTNKTVLETCPESLKAPVWDPINALTPTNACDLVVQAPKDPTSMAWWTRTAPLLEALFSASESYTPAQTASHMRNFRDIAVASFGSPRASFLLCNDGSPFEPSWNFCAGKSTIRYSFEPLGFHAGTDLDPFGGLVVGNMIEDLVKSASDVDLRWFSQIVNGWFVQKPSQVAAAIAKLPMGKTRVPQCFLAFDHKGDRRMLKAYLFPILKHLVTGLSTERLTFDMIRSLQPYGEHFQLPSQKLETFLLNCPFLIPVEMIAIDCIDPSKARIKVYARTESVSKSTLHHCVTMGGVQCDSMTVRGLEELNKIWHLICGEPDGMSFEQEKAPRDVDTLHKGICFVFEMKAGKEHIDVKAHVPWANYQESDKQAGANVTSMLRLLGMDEAAMLHAKGMSAIDNLNPERDSSKVGLHSYIAFNYAESGSYLSSYFSAQCRRP